MDLRNILETHRDKIIREWVSRMHTEVSERYSARPVEEITLTISEAAEANFAVLTEDDFSKMNIFIEKISRMRLDVGFSLSEVQGAFELYRTVLMPILVKELDGPPLLDALQKLNNCLAHTIRKFSDYFQALHEKAIRDHAEDLEREVENRTKELTESEAKYRVLVEDINDGYFVNQKGIVVFANKAFCDMHGYTTEEVIGRPYMDFIAPESSREVAEICAGRMSTGKAPDQYVYLRRCKDGRTLYSENKAKLITYQGEAATAGLCRDITERMEVEKQRLKLMELENERKTIALETLHQLMVTLSHHLLNANTIIGGMARRSARAESEGERLASLQVIREQTEKTETVIAALKRVAEIRTADYTHETNTLMIDVKNEIEETLAKLEHKEE